MMAAGPIPSRRVFRAVSEPRRGTGGCKARGGRAAGAGRTEMIEYETADGRWHSETAAGNDRPETEVEG
jgi:hypothetical protein